MVAVDRRKEDLQQSGSGGNRTSIGAVCAGILDQEGEIWGWDRFRHRLDGHTGGNESSNTSTAMVDCKTHLRFLRNGQDDEATAEMG
jgi:hypothetical protein